MAFQPSPGFGIGDGPVKHLAHRIVGARQPPATRDPLLDRQPAPGVSARLVRRRCVVEFPEFLAGFGVVRRDEAAGTRLAGARRDQLAVGDEWRRRVLGELLVVLNLGFPANFAGSNIERHYSAVWRVEEY